MDGIALRLSLAERVALLPKKERKALFARAKEQERIAFLTSWCIWARPGQLPPPGDWRVWLLMAGRGYGKTRAGAEWVHWLAEEKGRRIALVGPTEDEVRAVMIEGASGLLASAPAGVEISWEPSRGVVSWGSGAQAFVYSAANPEKLRGPEHDFAWCDELGKWAEAEASWDNLMFGLRRGRFPRALATTTPRPTPLMRALERRADVAVTRGRTEDNVLLAESFVAYVKGLYGGTQLGRQELDGELIEDAQGSLWPRRLIERCRILPGTGRGTATRSGVERSAGIAAAGSPLHHAPHGSPPRPGEDLRRVVIGVDPPVSAEGDACGIVACAVDAAGHAHVIGDHSVRGLSPEGWARAVSAAAGAHGADRVIAERNQGGDMVAAVLRGAAPRLPVRLVSASRGKAARAEPVAALFERGEAWFAGCFPELEDELAGLCAGGRYQGPGRSPDRADAMVWAMTELMLAPARAEPRIHWI